MSKQERAALAKKHVEELEKSAAWDIHMSQVYTLFYGGPNGNPANTLKKCNTEMKIKLEGCDTVTALLDVSKENPVKVAILNFASYKNPGGGYLKGSFAQEEALCSESTLYPVLAKFEQTYYDWNREHLNHALYTNRALYSPSIVFESSGYIHTARGRQKSYWLKLK